MTGFSLLSQILKTGYCFWHQDSELKNYFNTIISLHDIHNVFNPSFYYDQNLKIFAFRAIANGGNQLLSYVYIEDKNECLIKNLTDDLCAELQEPRVIDPKVFKLNGELYLTFNSGWVPDGNNIFIMKVYPAIEAPKRIVYANRQKQERNWSFFSENGEIYALYWINPLKILKLNKADSGTWEFEDWYSSVKQNSDIPPDLTLGTQLSLSNGLYYFVAHNKFFINKKKLYLGRICALDFDQKIVLTDKRWLSHSLISLLGSKIKHNSNLFSCTYFSGIQVLDNYLRFGYGINDINFGFSKYKIDKLFAAQKA